MATGTAATAMAMPGGMATTAMATIPMAMTRRTLVAPTTVTALMQMDLLETAVAMVAVTAVDDAKP
jgi:hypothetical protein